MHELTVTSLIVEALLDLAGRQRANRVLEINLRVGKLRALSLDQLRFCYGVLSRGTILEGSRLIIEQSVGKVRCDNCGYAGEFDPEGDEYHFGLRPFVCQSCGSSLSVEGGDECVISKVRMQLPSSAETPAVP